MKRLLRLTVILAALIFVMVNAARLIGSTRPASKAIQYWHLTDCAPPCWAGITLNSTSMDEAVERVTHLFSDYKPTQGEAFIRSWFKGDDLARISIIHLEFSGEFLSEIFLLSNSRDDSLPTLGEVVAKFGPPTCVFTFSSSRLYFEDASGQVIVSIEANQLSLISPVYEIEIGGTHDNLNCQIPSSVPWRGFRSAELYLADMANLK